MIYWLQHELNITIIYLIGNFLSNFNVSGSTFVQGTFVALHFCGITLLWHIHCSRNNRVCKPNLH